MGLPDDGTTPNATTNNKDDQQGLLLNKNGPTADCSAAGAHIKGLKKKTPLTQLGYDYRDGTHCSGGAPRFNIVTSAGLVFSGSCQSGVTTTAPQDPQWKRVVLTFANGGLTIPAGTQVDSIDVIYDEGTDTPGTSDPNGVGLANIDNININGVYITQGHGIDEPHGHDRHDD